MLKRNIRIFHFTCLCHAVTNQSMSSMMILKVKCLSSHFVHNRADITYISTLACLKFHCLSAYFIRKQTAFSVEFSQFFLLKLLKCLQGLKYRLSSYNSFHSKENHGAIRGMKLNGVIYQDYLLGRHDVF